MLGKEKRLGLLLDTIDMAALPLEKEEYGDGDGRVDIASLVGIHVVALVSRRRRRMRREERLGLLSRRR